MLKTNKENWGIDFIQKGLYINKTEDKKLSTKGENEHKENELKFTKGLYSFNMGLPPIQGH
jgi:hypothetical protein